MSINVEHLNREEGLFLHLLVESLMPQMSHDRARVLAAIKAAGGTARLYRCGLPAADVAHGILSRTGGLS